MTSQALSFEPQVFGAYEPLIELAAGGMAAVYVARQTGPGDIERLVALKRVHRHLLAEREFRDLFRDEARILANVRHPNIVPLIDVFDGDGELLLVLEYVEGTALSSLLGAAARDGALLPPAIASRIVADALQGLHAAHEARDVRGQPLEIIHRDVSPQNVLVGLDGASRLIDFGIAKAAARITTTATGVMRGKLAYMSPEQIKTQPLDRRADVFSAGVVLYHALTGKKPFAGDNEGDLLLSVLLGEIPPVSEARPDVPPAVDEVLRIALERDRDARFPTAAAFQEALERALPPASHRETAQEVARWRGAAIAERAEAIRERLVRSHGRLRAAVTAEPVDAPTLVAAPRFSVQPAPKRTPWGLFIAAALVGLVAALTGFTLASRRDAQNEPVAPAVPTMSVATEAPTPVASAAPSAAPLPEVRATSARTGAAPRAASTPARPTDLHRSPYGTH